MASQPPANPYQPPENEPDATPFAGRQKAFEFLYQQLTDPAGTETSLILGRRDSGKTALLQHFNRYFDESFVEVYIPLKQHALTSEADWMRLLVDGAARALAERNYTLSRLPEFDGADNTMRQWFNDTYLPDLLAIIRRHRRLGFLIDDAEILLTAVDNGNLPADSVPYLHSLVQHHPQIGVVLTLDTRHEGDIAKLNPLVTLEDVFRLTNLSEDETDWLLTEPVSGYYRLTPDALAAVYKATGGQPRLLQRFGSHLFQRWEGQPSRDTLTVEDVKAVTPLIYAQSEGDFRVAWSEATRNERLVLTAIISRIYADPLGTITPAALESWMVETDYPLDSTTIHAALRGLEYREIIEQTSSGIRLNAGMMQIWLLENGRLTDSTPRSGERRPALRWLALAGIVVLVVALALIASQGDTPATPDNAATLEPTVTLVTSP